MNTTFTIFCCCIYLTVFSQKKQFSQIAYTGTSIQTDLCQNKKVVLEAYPRENGSIYHWFKDNQEISQTLVPFYEAISEGKYSVKVMMGDSATKTSTSLNIGKCDEPNKETTKNETLVNTPIISSYFLPTLSTPNPILCGTNTSITLTASPSGGGYTYVWQKSTSEFGIFTTIVGANTSTYNATTIGYYKVQISDGTDTFFTNVINISATPYAYITDGSGNIRYGDIYTGVNQVVPINVKLFGLGPWYCSYSNGTDTKTFMTTNSNNVINISAEQNRGFFLSTVSNSCGSSNNNKGSVRLIVDGSTSMSIPNPNTTNICAGSSINISYNTIGNWTNTRNLTIDLVDATTNNNVSNAAVYGVFTNPIVFRVPSNLPLNGTYKFRVTPQLPAIYNSYSSSIYTVTSVGCTPTATFTANPTNQACNVTLTASPNGTGYSYQWYKDGIQIPNANSNNYVAPESGNYSVKISGNGINSNSAQQVITVNGFTPKIDSNNPILCGSNVSVTLSAMPNTNGNTYQWYSYNNLTGSRSIMIGETNATLTTSVAGYYVVFVSNGNCTGISSPYQVATTPYAIMSDMNDVTYSNIHIPSGQSGQIKVKFFGEGPYTFTYYNGSTSKTIITSNNPYILTVNPEQNRYFFLISLRTDCTTNGGASGGAYTIIDSGTSLSLPTPSSTNVCAGGAINIPFTTIGTWATERSLSVFLTDVNGNSVSNSSQQGYSSNPITYNLPSSLTLNATYKVNIYSSLPYILGGTIQSSYSLKVTNTGCLPSATFTSSPSNQACTPSLVASPNGNGYSYQWYKDGGIIANATSASYLPTQTGLYSVNISGNGINSMSLQQTITVLGFTAKIDVPNPVLCGANTSATLSANPIANGNTYQWYTYNSSNGLRTIINGATSAAYTATSVGQYTVFIDNGTCSSYSANTQVSATPYAVISDMNDNTNATVNISLGQSAALKVKFYGDGPYNFSYYDGSNIKNYSTSTNPYIFNVSPEQNRRYYMSSFSGACGSGNTNGSVRIVVDATTAIQLPTPTTTNICTGGSIEIPFTTVGTWGTERKIVLELIDANGNYVNNSNQSYFFSSPIIYQIPSTLLLNGVYKIRASSNVPSISSVVSTYSLTVTNTGCTPAASFSVSGSNVSCTNTVLSAFPSGSGYTYNWYKNGNLSQTSTFNDYNVTESGNYYVVVTNNNGYNSTSPTQTFSTSGILRYLNYTQNSLCNNVGTTNISTVNPPSGSTFQWYYSPTGFNHTAIANSNVATYAASQPGSYYCIIENGSCQIQTDEVVTCSALINFTSTTVCKGSSISVPFNVYSSNSIFTLQLLNANDNSIVNANLGTLNSSGIYPLVINVSLPNTVGEGTYKFQLISNQGYTSPPSIGILTIGNSIAPNAPTLLASPALVNAGESSTITATGCAGIVIWSDGFSGTTRTVTVSTTSISYTAYCTNGACTSAISSVSVRLNCDIFEPNDSYITSKLITTNTYESPDICLDSGTDTDWYAWVFNGKVYYIVIKPFSNNHVGAYKFTMSLVNGVLTVESLPTTNGSQNLDTYAYLYDSNGNTILMSDDDSGINAFSKFSYTLQNPCPYTLHLYSSLFDIINDSTPKATRITASNKIQNNVMVNYRGEASIILNPGFEVNPTNGGKFLAEIKGCFEN